METQFIYMVQVRNIHTGTCYVKLGYTSNILKRMQQLQNRNKHYEYTKYQLFQHSKKKIGYIHDEQKIHRTNKNNNAGVKREWMPEGYTECYESYYSNDLVLQLSKLDYVCVYNEQEHYGERIKPMFEWY